MISPCRTRLNRAVRGVCGVRGVRGVRGMSLPRNTDFIVGAHYWKRPWALAGSSRLIFMAAPVAMAMSAIVADPKIISVRHWAHFRRFIYRTWTVLSNSPPKEGAITWGRYASAIVIACKIVATHNRVRFRACQNTSFRVAATPPVLTRKRVAGLLIPAL